MVGRRPALRVVEEGGSVKPEVKGKVYLREEEEQLYCSVLHVSHDQIVLHVSQDRIVLHVSHAEIVGNQQRVGVFWKRISKHYDKNRSPELRLW